jgi:signal transduction histidine kinase
MERARREPLRTASALVVAALAVSVNVAGTALYGESAPYVGFLDLARTALPGVVLAIAAAIVGLLGRGGMGAPVLTVASVASGAPWLAIGLEQRSAAWVAVDALGLLLVPSVIALGLLFPDGRLTETTDRVVASAVGLLGLGAMATQAGAQDPGGWAWCRCLANPLAVLPAGPEGYDRLLDWLWVAHLTVVCVGLFAVARRRSRWGRGLPSAFRATFVVLTLCWVVVDLTTLRSTGGAPTMVRALRDAALVLLPCLYVAGFAAQRPSRAHVADLLLAAREEAAPRRLQALVARAIGDPQAVVAWWDPVRGDFRDRDYEPVAVPVRGLLRVEAEGRPIALVVAERLDQLDAGVRDSVAEALLLAAENRRLTAELRASLEQVRDSRARIVAAGDDTRRRIERDLHDGAQQLLVSTGIKLNLAAARAGDHDAVLAGVLDEASTELIQALEELRSLASGIAPTSLVHGSLDNALNELALRSVVPTTVRVSGAGEPDERVASTVYFVVAECLANVAKHAGALHATVDVVLGETLRVSVTDDGQGGATLIGPGTGLRGLVDRIEARGGRLELASGSSGTTVTATVPAAGLDQ